jgi:hypothetical protein
MDVKGYGMVSYGQDGCDLGQSDRGQCRVLVNRAMNLRFPLSRKFFSTLAVSQEGLSSVEYVIVFICNEVRFS